MFNTKFYNTVPTLKKLIFGSVCSRARRVRGELRSTRVKPEVREGRCCIARRPTSTSTKFRLVASLVQQVFKLILVLVSQMALLGFLRFLSFYLPRDKNLTLCCNWPIREAKIGPMTDLSGQFQHIVKFYARILFIGSGLGSCSKIQLSAKLLISNFSDSHLRRYQSQTYAG